MAIARYYSENPRFFVAVDCIIFGFENNELQLLLQERNFEPFRGEPALMGGFVQEDESLDEAAYRVLRERTGCKDVYMEQVGAFGAIDRDPGARVISTAYYALIDKAKIDPETTRRFHGRWVGIKEMPILYFDHLKMVRKALFLLRDKISYKPVGFSLLPKEFTLTQLQNLYEAILDEEIDKRNFRKRIHEMGYIEKTGGVDKNSSKRGAALYRFNIEKYNEKKDFRL